MIVLGGLGGGRPEREENNISGVGEPLGPSGVAYTLQPSACSARFGTGNRSLPSTLIVGLPQNVTGGRSVLGTGISLRTRAAPGAPRA